MMMAGDVDFDFGRCVRFVSASLLPIGKAKRTLLPTSGCDSVTAIKTPGFIFRFLRECHAPFWGCRADKLLISRVAQKQSKRDLIIFGDRARLICPHKCRYGRAITA